jgi:hypothetical protein
MKEYNFICEVRSHSNPNKFYTIKVDGNGLFSCNCPSWIFNQRGNRTCKHIDELRRRGLTLDGVGRLIIIEATDMGGWQSDVMHLCKNYPEQCDSCKMRFICWTQREAKFTAEQAESVGFKYR